MPLDLGKFYRVRARFFWSGLGAFTLGAAGMVVDWTTGLPTPVKGAFTGLWLVVMFIGALLYYFGARLPLRETLELADDHGGALTLTELAKGLQVNLWTAEKTLNALRRKRLVYLDSEQHEREVYVFRDSVKLPLEQALRIASENAGRLSEKDLVGAGVSADLARRTLVAMVVKGFAEEDGAGGVHVVTGDPSAMTRDSASSPPTSPHAGGAAARARDAGSELER